MACNMSAVRSRYPPPEIRSLSSRGLGHDPFTVGTGVRIPVGMPRYKARQVSACRAFGYLEIGMAKGKALNSEVSSAYRWLYR